MTASRDPDRLIHAFIHEGLDELPDPVYDAVRDRIEQTRQRAFIGPWRTSDMSRYLKIGLAAAAVVVIAVIGYQFLGNSNTGGPGATETSQPTATPAASAEPSVLAQGEIAPGSHVLRAAGDSAQPVPVTVTIATTGWYGEPGGGILVKDDNPDPRHGAGMIMFEGDLYVYGDPCHWSTTMPDAPATTVDEFVAAMAAQASRDASAPVDVTVGGHAGRSITLHVPDDAVFADCDQGTFGSWTVPGGQDPYRYHQGPGQIDTLWVVEVDGELVVFDWGYYAQTPADDIDELRAIVESITFG